MATPNILNVSTINGNTAVANVTTVATAVVSNPAASNKITKINSENLKINIISIDKILIFINDIFSNKILPGSYCLLGKFLKIKKILKYFNKNKNKKFLMKYESKKKISQVQKKFKDLKYIYSNENIPKYILKTIK